MPDVTNFELFGEKVNVKDVTARNLINTINQNIVRIDNEINKIKQSEIVFIGDSFSTGYQPGGGVLDWPIPNLVADMLNLNLHKYAANAAGFTVSGDGNKRFIDLANEAVNDNSYSHDKVKYVVVFGGINDINNNPSGNLYQESRRVYTTLCSAFRNSEIHYIPNWGAVAIPDIQELLFRELSKSGDTANYSFSVFYSAITVLMGKMECLNNDNVHPNLIGSYRYAEAISAYLNGGEVVTSFKVDLITKPGWIINYLNMYRSTDRIRIWGSAETTAPITTTNTTICEIPPSGAFAGDVFVTAPSNFGGSDCTIKITPPVALNSAPQNGKIEMFHDHGATIGSGSNVLINVEIPLLNYN